MHWNIMKKTTPQMMVLFWMTDLNHFFRTIRNA